MQLGGLKCNAKMQKCKCKCKNKASQNDHLWAPGTICLPQKLFLDMPWCGEPRNTIFIPWNFQIFENIGGFMKLHFSDSLGTPRRENVQVSGAEMPTGTVKKMHKLQLGQKSPKIQKMQKMQIAVPPLCGAKMPANYPDME